MDDTQDRRKVVLITGGSSGIGEATAIEYAKLDFKVAVTGRNQERLDNVLGKLIEVSPSKDQDNFLALNANFEDQEQVEPLVERTVAKFGKLDILINNAGYDIMRHGLHTQEFFDEFQRTIQVNLIAATRVAQLASSHLIKTKGVIINISSNCDRIAMPSIGYSVSKAGLSMLTKTLANALEGTGVRVVTVSPGPIKTNIFEGIDKFGQFASLLRAGEPKEVADTIVFLTSDKASYIHGCTIDVDGGVLPKFGGAFSGELFAHLRK